MQVKEPLALVIFDSAGALGRMYAGDREAWDRIAGHAFHHRADFNGTESYSILSEALAIAGEGCRPKGKCLMTGASFVQETCEQKARPTP